MLDKSAVLERLAAARAMGLDLSEVKGKFSLDSDNRIHAAPSRVFYTCHYNNKGTIFGSSWADFEQELSKPDRQLCTCYADVSLPGGKNMMGPALLFYESAWGLSRALDRAEAEVGHLSVETAFSLVEALDDINNIGKLVFLRKHSELAVRSLVERMMKLICGPFSFEDLNLIFACVTMSHAFHSWPLEAKASMAKASLKLDDVVVFIHDPDGMKRAVDTIRSVSATSLLTRASSDIPRGLINEWVHGPLAGSGIYPHPGGLSFLFALRMIETAGEPVFVVSFPVADALSRATRMSFTPLAGFEPTPASLEAAATFAADGSWADYAALWFAACNA